MSLDIRCSFELRTPSDEHPGKFVYTRIWLDGYHQDGYVRASTPPAVGDTVWLTERGGRGSGTYRVIARDWEYPAYGSMVWPHGTAEPTVGPLARCLVERAEGFIQDEAPHEDEDGAE